VIGNAASAVQFIPQLAKIAKQVTIFQRSANWMLPKQDRMYKNWEKKLVARFPSLLRFYRNRLWLLGGALFLLMKSGNNLLRKFYQRQTKRFIRKHIKDETLVQHLIPHYPLGARRVLFSDDYYPALAQENVSLTANPIDAITTNGVLTKNQSEYEFDLIVYGTGFKTNPFMMGLDINGKDGITIQEAWKFGPKNYLGMTVDGFPNMFQMYGPNTNLGHNSIIIMSEAQANYITQCVAQIHSNKMKSFEVKKGVIDTYHQDTQARLKKMIWGKVDHSWYMTANGDLPNNWPGRTMEYMRRTKRVNLEDYDVT
jgi:cation diffusion facilitator CzcD-associated flavoprotein CzcO